MNKQLFKPLLAFVLVSVVYATPIFAADADQDGDDSTESSPGEGAPGKVANCNPNASNCDESSARSNSNDQGQVPSTFNDAARPSADAPQNIDATGNDAGSETRPSGMGQTDSDRSKTGPSTSSRGTSSGGGMNTGGGGGGGNGGGAMGSGGGR